MRLLPVIVAVLFIALPAAATIDEVGTGPIRFEELVVEGASHVGEPTIGIPWNTDSLFFHSGSKTIKGVFGPDDSVTWTDVTPEYQVPTNLDPMLVADEDTGRILAGGLHGACSVMYYSDDDGVTWLPAGNICSGAQFDHQSIGIGPKPIVGNPDKVPQLQNAYYCGQLILIGCSVSLDGGQSWTAPSPAAPAYANNGCGGFHGHWRISRVTGTAFLPVPGCNAMGMIIPNIAGEEGTETAGVTGITWDARLVTGSHQWDGGFDPSIGIGRGDGWLWYGMADHMGARMGMSKDEGKTWEMLGGSLAADRTLNETWQEVDAEGRVTPTTWLDVGLFHDPPIVAAQFADVQTGDDDRVAFTFLGLEDLDGQPGFAEYGESRRVLYDCNPHLRDEDDNPLENREWHYYAAYSFDAGITWQVHKLTDHPVQIGGIWDGGGGNPCRNLLDFNDMDIDSYGRVHIGYADGCIGNCTDEGEQRYSREPRILRQVAGRTLFSAYDVVLDAAQDIDGDGIRNEDDDDMDGDGIPNAEDPDADGDGEIDSPETESVDNDAPLPLAAVLVGLLVALRRRR